MASAADTALERLSHAERPVRMAVEIGLVVCLALLAARLVWTIAAPSESVAKYTDRPLPSPMRGAASSLAITADRTLLVTTNPFSQDTVELVVEDAPETSLNLQLIGLRMSTEGGLAGNAIIRTPNGMAKNFGINDELLAGVTLERILSDRVIINRDGANETLLLGGRGVGLSVITDDSQTTPPEAGALAPRDGSNPAAQGGVIDVRMPGPEVFLGAVNATREVANGQTVGYRLSPIGGIETMRKAGLQPGDLLQSLNGVSVATLDTADLIDNLSTVQTAELQIMRNGSSRTVRLRFDE